MVETKQQTAFEISEKLPAFPPISNSSVFSSIIFQELSMTWNDTLEVIDVDNSISPKAAQAKLKVTVGPQKPEASVIDLDSEPEDIIFIDDDVDGKTIKTNLQQKSCSVNGNGFNSNGKRPSHVNMAKPLIKKTVISKKEWSTTSSNKVNDVSKSKPILIHEDLMPLQPFLGPCQSLTKVVSLDCEMVRVVGNIQVIARCSIVNYDGHVLFDSMIKPEEKIVDYVTWVSGIKPTDLATSLPFSHYKEKVFKMLTDAIIVGHSLKGDLEAMKFPYKAENIRDLGQYARLRENNMALSLKKLTAKHLGVSIQRGPHNSVEDARAAMALYRKFETQWEKDMEEEAARKRL